MIREYLPYFFILPPLLYALLSFIAVRSFFRKKTPTILHTPPVSILKPLKGLDTDSRQNLASFCQQTYPQYQLVFAVQSPVDPSVALVQELIRDYPQVDIELVVDCSVHGANGKVNNLINACPQAKYDILVVSDSDIRVGHDYLAGVVSLFADSEVGLVTSLYRGANVHAAGAAVEALGFTAEMMPNVIVAQKLEGLSFALGASMAVRRKALECIGGFARLKDLLADDYQLGNLIHRAGWKIVLSADFVESVMQLESFFNIFSRQLRWCRTMRVSRPWGYLASGITQPVTAVMLSIAVAGVTFQTVAAAGLLYLVRGAILTYYSLNLVKDGLLPRYLWLLPFRDALSTLTWALSFLGNRVQWRGEIYTLRADGRMIKAD